MEKEKARTFETFLTYALLAVFGLMSFLLNNLQYFWLPNGTDEYAYMGIARRLVIFENKASMLLPFTGDSLLYSYFLGLMHSLTEVPLEVLMRLFHGFLLFCLVGLTYKLGRRFSQTIGFTAAALVGFLFSPVFYPGQAYMTPTLFVHLSILLTLILMLEKRYREVVVVLILSTFLMWWSIIPLVLIILFLLFKWQSRIHIALLVVALLTAYFLVSYPPFLNLFSLPIDFGVYHSGYLNTLWHSMFRYYFPALIVLSFFFKNRFTSKFAVDDELKRVVFALLATSATVYFLTGSYLHLRGIFILLLGVALLVGLAFESLSHMPFRRPFLKKLWPFALAVYIIFISYQTGRVYAGEIAPIPPVIPSEIQAFKWLANSQDMAQNLILSDHATIFTSMFYIDSLDSDYFQNFSSVDYYTRKDRDRFQYFEPATPQMKKLVSFLSAPAMNYDSLEFIRLLEEVFSPEEIFIVISPRTRQVVQIFEKTDHAQLLDARVFDKEGHIPSFEGEAKFKANSLFERVYDNGETQIYRYSSSILK